MQKVLKEDNTELTYQKKKFLWQNPFNAFVFLSRDSSFGFSSLIEMSDWLALWFVHSFIHCNLIFRIATINNIRQLMRLIRWGPFSWNTTLSDSFVFKFFSPLLSCLKVSITKMEYIAWYQMACFDVKVLSFAVLLFKTDTKLFLVHTVYAVFKLILC